jgi:hypothetical protein
LVVSPMPCPPGARVNSGSGRLIPGFLLDQQVARIVGGE